MLAQRVAVGDHEMEFARGWVVEFVFAKLLSSESNTNRAWNPIKPMSVPTNLIVTRSMFSHGRLTPQTWKERQFSNGCQSTNILNAASFRLIHLKRVLKEFHTLATRKSLARSHGSQSDYRRGYMGDDSCQAPTPNHF